MLEKRVVVHGGIISFGGDADTNAAIVGAVLGAKFGFREIPERLVKYLYNGSWIYKELAAMIEAMRLPTPFDVLSYQ